MNVGWEGVIFIWVVFLWPVLVTAGYLLWKKGVILKKSMFFLASGAVGYAVLISANFLAYLLLRTFLNIEELGRNPSAETIVNFWALAAAAILLVLPVLSTHLLAKRFS